MSANVVVPADSKSSSSYQVLVFDLQRGPNRFQEVSSARKPEITECSSLSLVEERVSSWSQSGMKRLFDSVCVLLALPLLAPISLVVALAIRFTSRGPVLFLQKRTGRHRRTFTILKFRTMEHCERGAHNTVTTTENQRFTPVGPFLRRWKLDELPQLLNVLMGEMSLVGPRPKLPEHQLGELRCRPGITGAATIAFAREEEVLSRLPDHRLNDYYHSIILPAKLLMDSEYTARATFVSDLKLIIDTALRRWDSSVIHKLLNIEGVEEERNIRRMKAPVSVIVPNRAARISRDESLASAD